MELSKLLLKLGLVCKECQCPIEVLVDRNSDGKVFRDKHGSIIVLKGSCENTEKICSFHRKEKVRKKREEKRTLWRRV